MPSDKLVPFRWPSGWTDPALLKLLESGPINCLLLEDSGRSKPIADAARNAGLTVREWSSLGAAPLAEVKWDSTAPETVITGLVWPRIKLSPGGRPDTAQAGPTGAPWIDSNSWVARLAAARAPHRPVWLGFELSKDDPVADAAAYQIAIADSAAAGAQWMIRLEDRLAGELAAANADALKTWRGILAAAAFFEKHRDWMSWEPWGALGVLSSFAGDSEFLAQEMLNLAARRNLHYRVLDRSATAGPKLEGLRAVLYVDNEPPSAGLKEKLDGFARAGGLVIVPRALGSKFAAGSPGPCPVAGYEQRPLGKGWVAVATRDWDDPYFLAADAHSLVSRRYDPVRLFNARSLWEHYSLAPDGRALLQLVGFTGRPNESLSMVVERRWRSASMYTVGAEAPAALEPVEVEGNLEYHLPPFSLYAALELKS